MAIQEIGLGVVANDGEGNPLREGGDKINQNFTDPSNAASYEVGGEAGQVPRNEDLGTASKANTGTAAGDVPTNSDLGSASTKDTGTATGQIPTADQLGVVESTNYTTGNLKMTVAYGINTRLYAYNNSGSNVSANSTVSGTLLTKGEFNSSGVFLDTTSSLGSGIYKNINDTSISDGQGGLWVKVAE